MRHHHIHIMKTTTCSATFLMHLLVNTNENPAVNKNYKCMVLYHGLRNVLDHITVLLMHSCLVIFYLI